jgi:hypothetical protein
LALIAIPDTPHHKNDGAGMVVPSRHAEPRFIHKEPDVTTSIEPGSKDQQNDNHRSSVARASLIAGGGFATSIATVLGVAGEYGLGDRATSYGIGAVCVVAALTMFMVAHLMRR